MCWLFVYSLASSPLGCIHLGVPPTIHSISTHHCSLTSITQCLEPVTVYPANEWFTHLFPGTMEGSGENMVHVLESLSASITHILLIPNSIHKPWALCVFLYSSRKSKIAPFRWLLWYTHLLASQVTKWRTESHNGHDICPSTLIILVTKLEVNRWKVSRVFSLLCTQPPPISLAPKSG